MTPIGSAEANLPLLHYGKGTAWFVFLSELYNQGTNEVRQLLNRFCHLLLIIFLITFFSPSYWSLLIVKSTDEATCTGHTLTAAGLSWQTLEYIILVASSGSVAGSSITVLKVEGLVCRSSFHLLSTAWALHRDLKVCVGKWTLGIDFTSGLETQLSLIYKCLVVCKSVSLPKLHIKVFEQCCTWWEQE